MTPSHDRHTGTTLDPIAAVRASIQRECPSLAKLQPRILHLALNEAEALAWQSGFPELVFPTLALEKVRELADWHERQRSLWRPNRRLAFAE